MRVLIGPRGTVIVGVEGLHRSASELRAKLAVRRHKTSSYYRLAAAIAAAEDELLGSAKRVTRDLKRMDKIYSYFDKRAEGGDAAAGNICSARVLRWRGLRKCSPSRVPSTKFAPRLTDSGPNTGPALASMPSARP